MCLCSGTEANVCQKTPTNVRCLVLNDEKPFKESTVYSNYHVLEKTEVIVKQQ